MPRTKIDSSRIKEIYDELSPSYDRREALLELFFIKRHRRAIFSQARGRVLEIGVGTGKNFRYYSHECEITGIDLSPGMLQIAEEHSKRLNQDIHLQVMDAHELQYADRSFDTVTSSLTLCTLVDPIHALSEMARVVRSNGTILLLEHGRSQRRMLSRWLDWLAPHFVENYGCHPNRNILSLVQAANLQILGMRRFLFGMIYAIECKPQRRAKVLRRL
jgi:ubiquinone/menaquinone biosynthesis C-methylase UbiE